MQSPSFGDWLKQKRKALDLTQAALASQVGCSAAAIRKIEAEERRPSAQIVERLSEILKIPQDQQTAFLRFARGDVKSAPPETKEKFPWHASAAPTHFNLPATVTSLIGRQQEITEVHEYLLRGDFRLVTLIGPPGIGKTRLSLEVAHRVLPAFPGGVFFVALAPLDEPSLIALAIIQALGYAEARNTSVKQRLVEGIGEKQILIVLDNCEHLIQEVAQLASELLSACSHLKLLTTSREALRIPGEWQYSVPTLEVPTGDAPIGVEAISTFPSVTLFAERARAVRSDFVLDDKNVQAVASICARLDGLPLAIELIAARIRLMSPQTLLTKLNDQFILYADGMRALPARQKTLHNAIDWSYKLLPMEEQKLFAWLSVFSGGFTLEAAESIFSRVITDKPITDIIASLLDKSLLQRALGEHGEPRFYMLAIVQHFALDLLRNRNEELKARDWHFDYFLDLAEAGESNMTGHGLMEWLPYLQAEQDNFRAAFEWSLASQMEAEKSLRLANALFPYWRVRSDFYEAQRWLDTVLKLPGSKDYPNAYAKALLSMGILKLIYIDPEVAEPLLLQSVTLARSLKDTRILAEALDFIGIAFARREKFEQAHAYLDESQTLFRAANDRKGLALTNWHLGTLAALEGQQAEAFEYQQQALALFQEVGDILRQSVLLQSLGRSLLDIGELEQGRATLRQALTNAYKLGSKLEMGHAFSAVSRAEKLLGNFTRAAQFLSIAQNLYLDCGAQSDLLSLRQELDRLQAHFNDAPLKTVLTDAETWKLEEAITYALENDD